MITFLRNALDQFFGHGSAAVTVPPMDGALRPNQVIEEAPVALTVAEPDNLVSADGRVLFSSGASVFALEAGAAVPVATFETPVSCMAADGSGGLAVGLESGRIVIRGGRHDGRTYDKLGGRPLFCPTALLFAGADQLIVCQGSTSNRPADWKRDLMERNASGSVWTISLASGAAEQLAGGLAWPYGLLSAEDGAALVVAESWRSRLLRLPLNGSGAPAEILGDLPGYPSRLAPAAGGGAWLTVFAPRSQMVEFILREKDYRLSMLEKVEPQFWMAPALSSGHSFREPLQGGGVKQMGILKPWAPTRSYGLVIRLDPQWLPTASLHSRADGRRHGITSCLETGGTLLAASRGGGVVVALEAGADPSSENVPEQKNKQVSDAASH